jgi:hypothetical protein
MLKNARVYYETMLTGWKTLHTQNKSMTIDLSEEGGEEEEENDIDEN